MIMVMFQQSISHDGMRGKYFALLCCVTGRTCEQRRLNHSDVDHAIKLVTTVALTLYSGGFAFGQGCTLEPEINGHQASSLPRSGLHVWRPYESAVNHRQGPLMYHVVRVHTRLLDLWEASHR